jgi:hypothetical protein
VEAPCMIKLLVWYSGCKAQCFNLYLLRIISCFMPTLKHFFSRQLLQYTRLSVSITQSPLQRPLIVCKKSRYISETWSKEKDPLCRMESDVIWWWWLHQHKNGLDQSVSQGLPLKARNWACAPSRT